MNKFFNQRFWQTFTIAVFSQLIVLIIAIFISMYVSGYLEKLTTLFESIDNAVGTIERVIENVDPTKITDISVAIGDGVETIGDGTGEAGASAIDSIGDALLNYRNKQDASND